MKAVILAGGFGTRLMEETTRRPKPMVEIGGRPILWHIMKIYSAHGINDFVICCGYKGNMIKEYFYNYSLSVSDMTVDLSNQSVEYHRNEHEPWRITLVDTGEEALTGGRLLAVRDYVEPHGTFCFTYGDGVADIDVTALVAHHRKQGLQATVTAVEPPGRYGALKLDGSNVTGFQEKPRGDGGRINGGFFVLEPSVFDLLDGPKSTWEAEPLDALASQGQLSAYNHDGFWQPVDTLREKKYLETLWASGDAPWKLW